jgi:hypothetical protein
MRIIAVILNVALLVIVISCLVAYGTTDLLGELLLASWVLLSFAVAIVNLLFLFFGELLLRHGWIRTYLERKTLEEQAKVDALKKDKETK